MSTDGIASGPPRQTLSPVAVLPARPEPLSSVPNESALIVVDMQNAYASKGGYLDRAGFDVEPAAAAIARIGDSIRSARKAGMQIVFFQNGWDQAYQEAGGPGSPNFHKSNALKLMRREPALAGTLLARGGWDYELVDALKPEAGDFVIHKAVTAPSSIPLSTACCSRVASAP